MLPSSTASFQPSTCPSSSSFDDTSKDARQSSVRSDFHKALRLLHRSSSVKSFLLTPFEPSSQLDLLICSRPSFTIATKEEQEGALPGQIGLCYLGLPAFSNKEGFSGGLVVTRYASRTHPLHDPSFISDVRIGRYVRDDASGEWCMITRSGRDRVVRLQYMHVNRQGDRERISLTCDSSLFDCGRYTDSVYFKCHDHEWHICPTKTQVGCCCQISVTPTPSASPGLMAAAHSFIREGAHEWVGTVRVTVLNRYSIVPLLDVDDTMMVRSTYKAGADNILSSQIRHLAILETMSESQSALTVHCSIAPSQTLYSEENHQESFGTKEEPGSDKTGHFDSLHYHVPSLPLTPPLTPTKNLELIDHEFSSLVPSSASMPWSPELMEEDLFTSTGSDEVADHFLISKDLPFSYFDDNEIECPMLPADLSTLPAGVESCLDGMDLEDLDDDCFSLMTSERDTHSVSSALSTAGSDGVPSPDSVPMPGDDVLDAISSLNLSSSAENMNPMTEQPSTGIKASEATIEIERGSTEPSTSSHGHVRVQSKSRVSPHKWHSGCSTSPEPANLSPEQKSVSADGSEASVSENTDFLASTIENSAEQSRKTQIRATMATDETLSLLPGSNSQDCSNIVQADNASSAFTVKPYIGGDAKRISACGPQYTVACNSIHANVDMKPSGAKLFQQPMYSVLPPMQGIPVEHGGGLPVLSPHQTLFSNPITTVPVDSHDPQDGGLSHGQLGATTGCRWGTFQGQNMPATCSSFTARHVGKVGEAPKLAPRPPGMNVTDGPVWNLSPVFGSNHWMMASRFEVLEKERKAEERRKKNRQAAARSNAKKKNLMDGIRTEINKCKERADYLTFVQAELRNENGSLRKRVSYLKCKGE